MYWMKQWICTSNSKSIFVTWWGLDVGSVKNIHNCTPYYFYIYYDIIIGSVRIVSVKIVPIVMM